MTMTNRLLLAIAILSLATIPLLARPVAADNNTGTLGQPNQSCQSVFPSGPDRKSTRLNSSHVSISYAVFCLKKKNSEPIAALGRRVGVVGAGGAVDRHRDRHHRAVPLVPPRRPRPARHHRVAGPALGPRRS